MPTVDKANYFFLFSCSYSFFCFCICLFLAYCFCFDFALAHALAHAFVFQSISFYVRFLCDCLSVFLSAWQKAPKCQSLTKNITFFSLFQLFLLQLISNNLAASHCVSSGQQKNYRYS